MDDRSKNVAEYLRDLQTRITHALEKIDGGARFVGDRWRRDEGGGGDSRLLTGGRIFEKAGVAFSHIRGSKLPPSASARRPDLAGRSYEAIGVSLVLHPDNPFVPTTHLNVRMFCSQPADDDPSGEPIWWFGGGFDLTPCYGFEDDAVHWHRAARTACEVLGTHAYERYKHECDEYFYLKHRDEPRGIGGIFFDDLNQPDFDTCFAFQRAVGDGFLDAYLPIVERRMDTPFGQHEKQFQLYRRGRYVEFNLVYDRGTLFGLQSGGRTESILLSMPPVVRWEYNWRPETGSQEARLSEVFLRPRDWLAGESS